jgi:hypothetical protein
MMMLFWLIFHKPYVHCLLAGQYVTLCRFADFGVYRCGILELTWIIKN